jgi:peptidoglycan/LPS O-acetylase OafA/YrhL
MSDKSKGFSAGYARHANRPDVPVLTGLRFVAAFSVLVAHGCATILADHETPLGAVYWLRQASGFGMTLFFVLCAQRICHSVTIMRRLVTEGAFAASSPICGPVLPGSIRLFCC